MREITGAVPKAVKQRIKQFSSCPGLTKPGISMCSSQDELLGTSDAVSKRVWRNMDGMFPTSKGRVNSSFPTPTLRNLRCLHASSFQMASVGGSTGLPSLSLPVWKIDEYS